MSKAEFKLVKDIIKQLKEGKAIQDASASLMEFLIQDLLDYAQIKAGKFRKNVQSFNIREAIEKVMCIQRQKAIENKVCFTVEYENIAEGKEQISFDDDFSPIIKTDEKRIQQILLNL